MFATIDATGFRLVNLPRIAAPTLDDDLGPSPQWSGDRSPMRRARSERARPDNAKRRTLRSHRLGR